jgi:hypothetical protein
VRIAGKAASNRQAGEIDSARLVVDPGWWPAYTNPRAARLYETFPRIALQLVILRARLLETKKVGNTLAAIWQRLKLRELLTNLCTVPHRQEWFAQ